MIESFVLFWMIECSFVWGLLLCAGPQQIFSSKMSGNILILGAVLSGFYMFIAAPTGPVQSILFSQWFMRDVYHWDGLTAIMTVLNIFATVLMTLYQRFSYAKALRPYQLGLIWMTFSGVQGIFCAQHALVFFIFFELIMIPISLWLLYYFNQDALLATKQFVMYTCFGSIFFLLGIVVCYVQQPEPSWIFSHFSQALVPGSLTIFLSFCFIIPFLVKIPVWPFHTWLPLAHTQAPTEGSVILASVVLKIGGYGLLRLIFLMGDHIVPVWGDVLIFVGVLSLPVMSLTAFAQTDWKKLIAYSSIVHMAWIVIASGLIIQKSPLSDMVYQGAVFQMVAHGLISMALFLIVGMLSHRTNTREIALYRSMAHVMPFFSSYITFFMLANASLPGTAGFVGEFLILQALYVYSPVLTVFALVNMIFCMIFNLKYFITFLSKDESQHRNYCMINDCQGAEHVFLALLAFLVVLTGIYPQSVFCIFLYG